MKDFLIKFDNSLNSFKVEEVEFSDINGIFCNVIGVHPYLLANKDAEVFHKENKLFFWEFLNNLLESDKKPFLILSSLKKYLKGNEADCANFTELRQLISEYTSQNKHTNYFFNSSIWWRFVEMTRTSSVGFLNEQLEQVKKDFAFFKSLHLYDLSSSKEVFEHSNRYIANNYLKDFDGGGHSGFITPNLYHNELECADTILSINTEEEKTKQKFPELVDLHDVTFRILLIDDKDGYNEKDKSYDINMSKANLIANLMLGSILEPFAAGKLHQLKDINNGLPDNLAKYDVLDIIKIIQSKVTDDELLEILTNITSNANTVTEKIEKLRELSKTNTNIEKEIEVLITHLENCKGYSTKDYIAERLIWKEEHIDCFFYTTDEEKRKEYVNNKYNCFDISEHKTSKNVQIIQVTNLADAIILLANESIRFDLILLDYLLGKKEDNPNDRQLSTDFFIWFQDKQGENKDVEYLRKQAWKKVYPKKDNEEEKTYKDRDELLALNKKIRQRLKSNRGPLRKLWIFPITAFNQTLIDDLTKNNIRLIDYYWHICKGVDPITTPYLFLRMLNSFLYLQLEESVFMEHEIKDFLKKSIKRLKKVDSSEDFIAVMGSDYTEFVQNFMNRSIIYRDKNNNSLFANYIWKHFYTNEKYRNEHILVNYIHRFYHRCAFGGNSEYRKMILFWRDMKLFIENNFPDWVNDNELNLETYYTILNQVYPK